MYTHQQFKAAGQRGGIASSSRKYKSLVTGHISTRTGLKRIHQRLGVDPELMVLVSVVPSSATSSVLI